MAAVKHEGRVKEKFVLRYEGFEVWADDFQFVLKRDHCHRQDYFFPTFQDLCEGIIEDKQLQINNVQNLEELANRISKEIQDLKIFIQEYLKTNPIPTLHI